jgi:hypothetical protein
MKKIKCFTYCIDYTESNEKSENSTMRDMEGKDLNEFQGSFI